MDLAPQLAKMAAQEKQLNTKVQEAKMDFSKDEQAAILASGAAGAVKELAGAAAAGAGAAAAGANIAKSNSIEKTRDQSLADLDAGKTTAFTNRADQAAVIKSHEAEIGRIKASNAPEAGAGDAAHIQQRQLTQEQQAAIRTHEDKISTAKSEIRQDIQAKHTAERQKIEAQMTLIQQGTQAVSGVIGAGGTMMSAVEDAERNAAATAGQMMDSWSDGISKSAQKAEEDVSAALQMLKDLSPRISFDGKG